MNYFSFKQWCHQVEKTHVALWLVEKMTHVLKMPVIFSSYVWFTQWLSIFNKKINIVASWKSQQHCLPYFEQKINRKWKVALFLHIKNRHFVLKIPLRRKMSLFGNTSFIKMVSKGKIWKTFCATSHEGLLEADWNMLTITCIAV